MVAKKIAVTNASPYIYKSHNPVAMPYKNICKSILRKNGI